MDHHGHPVRGQPDVEADPVGVVGDGLVEGGQRVLGGPVDGPPVRDHLHPGRRRVGGLRGRCGEQQDRRPVTAEAVAVRVLERNM